MEEKIKIEVDKDIFYLVDEYIESRKADFKTIKAAIKKDDFEKVKQLSHKMRGSAGYFGMMDLTNMAKEMEENALNQDKIFLQDLLNKMVLYLENVQPVEKAVSV